MILVRSKSDMPNTDQWNVRRWGALPVTAYWWRRHRDGWWWTWKGYRYTLFLHPPTEDRVKLYQMGYKVIW